jgi:predicted O-methyltransferase YrrM
MMHCIRPWKLFDLVPEILASERLVTMKIPIRRSAERSDSSLRLLDLMCLIACVRIVEAKRMFEFGTFLGNSALHMALNSSPDAKIFTLDADDATLEAAGTLSTYSWRDEHPMEFESVPEKSKIVCLRQDSRVLGASPYFGTMDLVLIDGDHERPAVAIDTANAWNMLTARGCLLWHDYRNPECAYNTTLIDSIARDRDLFHVEDTMLAIYFRDGSVVQRLKEPQSK